MQIITGLCLMFTVPTCIMFWKFMFELEKKEDETVEKMFNNTRQDNCNNKK